MDESIIPHPQVAPAEHAGRHSLVGRKDSRERGQRQPHLVLILRGVSEVGMSTSKEARARCGSSFHPLVWNNAGDQFAKLKFSPSRPKFTFPLA